MVSQSRVFTTDSKNAVTAVPKVFTQRICDVFLAVWYYHKVTLNPVQKLSKSLLSFCSLLQKPTGVPPWNPQA